MDRREELKAGAFSGFVVVVVEVGKTEVICRRDCCLGCAGFAGRRNFNVMILFAI